MSSWSHSLGEGKRSLWITAAAIFAAALLVRLAFFAWRGPIYPPIQQDYLPLARNILAHGVFSLDTAPPFRPYTRHPPLYPAFLAALGWCVGLSPKSVIVVQAILDAGVAALVLLLARMVVPPRWAAAAALAYCFHLGAIGATLSLMTETLFTALLAGAVAAIVMGQLKDRPVLTASGGIGIGLAALCRPIALLLPFAFIGARLLAPRLPRSPLHSSLLLMGTLLTVTPWIVRCSLAAHQLVIIQTGVAETVYVGPNSDWTRQGSFWDRWRNSMPSSDAAQLAENDRFGIQQTVRNLWTSPGWYLYSRAHDYRYLFLYNYGRVVGITEPVSQLAARRDRLRLGVIGLLLVIFTAIPLALGVVGLACVRQHPTAGLCAAMWIYTALIHIPLWAEARYWIPALPFLLVSGAAGTHLLATRFLHRPPTPGTSGARLAIRLECPSALARDAKG